MIMYYHMSTVKPNVRRLASLLAGVLVLFGTTGAAALDALVHAQHSPAAHEESGGGPESQGTECHLCLVVAARAVPADAPALLAALPALQAIAGDAVAATRALHAVSCHVTLPGRGPPTA
jgi:hypothetical protein